MNDDVPHETDVAVVGAVAWQLFVEIVVVGLGSVAVASGELGLGRPLRRVLHHRSARTVTFLRAKKANCEKDHHTVYTSK